MRRCPVGVPSWKVIVVLCSIQWTSVNIVHSENKIRSLGSQVLLGYFWVPGPRSCFRVRRSWFQILGFTFPVCWNLSILLVFLYKNSINSEVHSNVLWISLLKICNILEVRSWYAQWYTFSYHCFFQYLLKTSENQIFFNDFSGYRKRAVLWNKLSRVSNRWYTSPARSTAKIIFCRFY